LKNKVVRWCGSFCGRFYWWNYRGIQTGISVQWFIHFTSKIADGIINEIFLLMIPSVNVNISPRPLPSPISPSSSPIPASKQTLPSQTANNHLLKHPSLLNTNHPSLFFVVTASVSWFIVDFIILISKSIFFNFNIKMSILLLLNVFFSICILLGYIHVLFFFLK